MTFVYLLGAGSQHHDEECKFSIRSVDKHHPTANVIIIGQKPLWYIGEHHPFTDENTKLINIWDKMIYACSLFDEWILMNDDFYLLSPLEPINYYISTFPNKHKEVGAMIKRSKDLYPESPNYMVHVPMFIKSSEFVKNIQRNVSPRMVYCNNDSTYPTRELERDVKITGTLTDYDVKSNPFFSLGNNWWNNRAFMGRLFPDKSKYERV